MKTIRDEVLPIDFTRLFLSDIFELKVRDKRFRGGWKIIEQFRGKGLLEMESDWEVIGKNRSIE